MTDILDNEKWDYEPFWSEAAKELSEEISSQEYETWFSNMTYNTSTENEIILSVPSSFYRDQVSQRFQKKIESRLYTLSGRNLKISFVIYPKRGKSKFTPEKSEKKTNLKIKSRAKHRQLNPLYTFERFIEGESNSFALNASLAISKNPGKAYNPCLIYGGVGLGKTHLLQAVGNDTYVSDPNLRVVYVTVETFTNEFIQSIKEKTGHRFKNKYRSADVLLIDDIQFLQGKVETQQEIFHTFNALYDANKQMVFSSDRPVSELKALPDRLINRFERGLNVDLQPPSYETRIAILNKKVEEKKFPIKNEIIELVCRNINSNVRDLEKALTKLVAYSQLINKEISTETANRELQEFFSKPEYLTVSIDSIQKVVADYFSLSPGELKGKKRTKNIAFPRQVAMYLSRTITEYTTTEVGLEFGGRDHTTVMYACQKIEERIKTDATLEPTIKLLIRKLKGNK